MTRATVVRADRQTTLVALPAWYNGQILVPVATWIMMATGQKRGALPGTEIWVRARLGVRSEVDLALQNWAPTEQLAPSLPVAAAG
ncbi:hypothetical protein OH809_43770 (plasmid) [Streptomyces sp. NBC_00873]|uniref:hypothetical protein n=1 Tax=unclassified Streptomyces TaxID=2593676 RepID=UPI002F919B5A|nr:hypothetical protein OH809_43770 [Streptomyces sp. NBC_00873]WTA49199.1 hypothetical protein OH821_44730 [Streptomyces sp. NBC_00842]